MPTSSHTTNTAGAASATTSASAQLSQTTDAKVANEHENDQSVVGRTQPAAKTAAMTTAMTAPDDEQISQLRRLVYQQQSTIKLLTEQLRHVHLRPWRTGTTFSSTADEQQRPQQYRRPWRPCGGERGSLPPPPAPAPIAKNNEESQSPPWTAVAKKQMKLLSHQWLTHFQQSLVAVVYKNQTDKRRRESILIITGLPSDPNVSDKLQVACYQWIWPPVRRSNGLTNWAPPARESAATVDYATRQVD